MCSRLLRKSAVTIAWCVMCFKRFCKNACHEVELAGRKVRVNKIGVDANMCCPQEVRISTPHRG